MSYLHLVCYTLPYKDTFPSTYKILSLSILPSKIKETTFQILNRMTWTQNKAFKSGLAPEPICLRCGAVVTYGAPPLHMWKLCSQNLGSFRERPHISPIAPFRRLHPSDHAHDTGNSIQQASPIHPSTPPRQQDSESYYSPTTRNQARHNLPACGAQNPRRQDELLHLRKQRTYCLHLRRS